ncbi:hypothetical protein P872_21720 [Rhodonellum psychrophilum GCM71 = DSM 17998]|uniref:Uncharacterized protein n=2 Tax=Rhodonellum TaxID=336827 RepID=U5BJ59_9BACT|nr:MULTISPECIES: hypothetical protein [Rhodonellum]ERM80455.1 hypothetical protein P872_21720 [Rhodonellum psychrophilum GCM71 = DSM 17998]MDO9551089.1 hypothetical protein [Rhodonellum sp.]SDZ23675.1 hypothetical protein SAMN05444412_10853 [Rhodonellum ikkaensis]
MKKSMNINQILLALLVSVMAFGCGSKDEQDLNPDKNSSGYFLKAKVNGTLVEFKTTTLLGADLSSSIQGVYDFSASGARQVTGQSALAESISIILRETSPITEKSYVGLVPFDYGFKGVILAYSLEVEDKVYTTDVTEPNVTLEITEIKPAFVKGRFNGVVRDFLSGETKTITEGEFFVKRGN